MAPAENARGDARVIEPRLNPDPLALPANRFPEIVQLVFHDVVDRIASRVYVVADLVDDFVDRQSIDHLFTTFDGCPEPAFRTGPCPACALGRATASPTSAFESPTSGPFRSLEASQSGERRTPARIPHERSDRTTSRRPPPQQQRDACPNRSANERRRQQVVLLLTPFVQIRFWA
jgi:hypothetical protein